MSAASSRRGSVNVSEARIAGLYDLQATIGKGHYAVVKEARHVFTNEHVAVKIIDKSKLDACSQRNLMQEVRCMKLVQHPAIVRLYEVIDTNTRLFLILEKGDCDMFEYMETRCGSKALQEGEAQKYFAQIVDAIDYCHKLHVVHRDLKPENVVFFEKLGMVKLTDFGFSNVYKPDQQLETACGSLAYSAPEILIGDNYDAPCVDVWSLGVILYMLVTGRLPFSGPSDSETLTAILDCRYAPPTHVSEGCRRLITRMLVRTPSDRATLESLRADPWVVAGRTGLVERLPLVGRDQLADDDHDTIVQQMVLGGIATAEQVATALDLNDYSHITATYYLLAERVLRCAREAEAAELIAQHDLAKSNPELCHVPSDSSFGDSEQPSANNANAPYGWRQRSCSVLREESEEEEYVPASMSRLSSRRSSRTTSPSTSVFGLHREYSARMSPAAIQEMLDVTGRLSSGRRTPESLASRLSSRSPSPPHHTSGGTAASAAAIAHRLSKLAVGAQIRKLSSSPHLREIYEEGEDDASVSNIVPMTTIVEASPTVKTFDERSPSMEERTRLSPHRQDSIRRSKTPPSTSTMTRVMSGSYGSVRSIRPRHAVVNAEIIKRYERASSEYRVPFMRHIPNPTRKISAPNVSSSRGHRSTSCSSSEASDDESRHGLVASRHCGGQHRRRHGSGDDDAAGGGVSGAGRSSRTSAPTTASRDRCSTAPSQLEHSKSENAGDRTDCFDFSGLTHQLQSLVLAPISELPFALPRFLTRRDSTRSNRKHKLSGDLERIVSSSPCSNGGTWYELRRARSTPSLLRAAPSSAAKTTPATGATTVSSTAALGVPTPCALECGVRLSVMHAAMPTA